MPKSVSLQFEFAFINASADRQLNVQPKKAMSGYFGGKRKLQKNIAQKTQTQITK